MAVLEFPFTRVARVTGRTLLTATGSSRSPFSAREQVQDWGGEWWSYSVEMAVTRGDDGRALSAFFTALGGKRNTFLFADPATADASGLISLGAPQVSGAGQSGNTLVTMGWVPGVHLKAGTFFSIGAGVATRLHMLTADAFPDASGDASLSILPALRASPADGLAIEYTSPKVHLRLTSPVPTDAGLSKLYRFSFTAEEAL